MSKSDWPHNCGRRKNRVGLYQEQEVNVVAVKEETDWEKVRIQAAISAMQGLCNSCHDSVIREIQESSDMERSNVISFLAVRMADSLIHELKKTISL